MGHTHVQPLARLYEDQPRLQILHAENDMSVKLHHIEWGDHAERVIKAESGWREPLRWNRKAEREGRIARVFCGSLMDICEARDELDDPRTRVFELAEQTPNLFWLFLTKRPENIPSMIPMSWDKCVSGIPQNVAFGATMENQKYADERSAELSKLDCITFASCEPLLGTVDLRKWLEYLPQLNWVICGGESGPKARPMSIQWVRDIISQCRAARVPCFVKQLGSAPVVEPGRQHHWDFGEAIGRTAKFSAIDKLYPSTSMWRVHLQSRKGNKVDEWPTDLRVREVPRRQGWNPTGLDGREWKQVPRR
jgi:protein gp37